MTALSTMTRRTLLGAAILPALPATKAAVQMLERISVKEAGAVGDGIADDTAAIQAATATGRPVHFPAGRYLMSAPVLHTGRVVWRGEGRASVIISDGDVLIANSASRSRIDNLAMVNRTTPWTIIRDPEHWQAIPSIKRSDAGYQPTVNDIDIWDKLSPVQQAQDIGPKIIFQGNSTNILIRRIYGNFVSIILYATTDSLVCNCDFKAGKNFGAGILFWNGDGQRGQRNRAIANRITMPSFSGIAFLNNEDGQVHDNIISLSGESGIKTWQNDASHGNRQCRRMRIERNSVTGAYFDGIDGSADYPHRGNADTQLIVMHNIIAGSYRTGIVVDGRRIRIVGNTISKCTGAGILADPVYESEVGDNHLDDNARINAEQGVHELSVAGDGNIIRGNQIVHRTRNGNAIYAPGHNTVSANRAVGGEVYLGPVKPDPIHRSS